MAGPVKPASPTTAEIREAQRALAAYLKKHERGRAREHDDLAADALVRALREYRKQVAASGESGVSFPALAIGCLKNTIMPHGQKGGRRREMPEDAAPPAVDTRRVVFTGRRKAKQKLPAGYDEAPDGTIVPGRFVTKNGQRCIEYRGAAPALQNLTVSDRAALEDLVALIPLTIMPSAEEDGGGFTVSVDVDAMDRSRWCRLSSAYRAAFGCTPEDAPWHWIGRRLVSLIERALLDALEQGTEPAAKGLTHRVNKALPLEDWITEDTIARILRDVQLGRGGGRDRKGDLSISRAVLRALNEPRSVLGLPVLRKILPA